MGASNGGTRISALIRGSNLHVAVRSRALDGEDVLRRHQGLALEHPALRLAFRAAGVPHPHKKF